mmetsp:Transcript_54070/g.160345  ORF Transcript_54070/g.160345 Transcript_54070/m.160345 type:complete len:384 (+) Transcript_54070:782-1933(+)
MSKLLRALGLGNVALVVLLGRLVVLLLRRLAQLRVALLRHLLVEQLGALLHVLHLGAHHLARGHLGLQLFLRVDEIERLEALGHPAVGRARHELEAADALPHLGRVANVALEVRKDAGAAPNGRARRDAPLGAHGARLLRAAARPRARHALAARARLEARPFRHDALRLAVRREEARARPVPLEESVRLGREAAVAQLDLAGGNLVVQRAARALDRVSERVPPDEDVARLAEPVDAPRRLHLLRRVERRLHQEDAARGRQRDADRRRRVGDDEDFRTRALLRLELLDQLVAARRRRLLIELVHLDAVGRARLGLAAAGRRRVELAARLALGGDELDQSRLHLVKAREDDDAHVGLAVAHRCEVVHQLAVLGHRAAHLVDDVRI